MRLNRNMTDAIIFIPSGCGFMDFLEVYTLRDQLQIIDILRYLHWDKLVANDVLVTLDNIQLNMGFVIPTMDDTSLHMNYIDQGLLASPQGQMRKIGESTWCVDREGVGTKKYNRKMAG